jgi:hypothetical protein
MGQPQIQIKNSLPLMGLFAKLSTGATARNNPGRFFDAFL